MTSNGLHQGEDYSVLLYSKVHLAEPNPSYGGERRSSQLKSSFMYGQGQVFHGNTITSEPSMEGQGVY